MATFWNHSLLQTNPIKWLHLIQYFFMCCCSSCRAEFISTTVIPQRISNYVLVWFYFISQTLFAHETIKVVYYWHPLKTTWNLCKSEKRSKYRCSDYICWMPYSLTMTCTLYVYTLFMDYIFVLIYFWFGKFAVVLFGWICLPRREKLFHICLETCKVAIELITFTFGK